MLGHLTAGIRAVFEALWGERIDYYALHPATVITQHADGSLDVRPEARPDGKPSPIGDLTHVPIDVSLPGAQVKVRKGARVLIGFRGGDEQARYASLTSMAMVESISWESGEKFTCLAKDHVFDEKGRPGARLGDLVGIGGGLFANPLLLTPCVIQLLTPIAPVAGPTPWAALAATAIAPPPPAITPGMTLLGAIQFGPKPLVGAVTTAKQRFKF